MRLRLNQYGVSGVVALFARGLDALAVLWLGVLWLGVLWLEVL